MRKVLTKARKVSGHRLRWPTGAAPLRRMASCSMHIVAQSMGFPTMSPTRPQPLRFSQESAPKEARSVRAFCTRAQDPLCTRTAEPVHDGEPWAYCFLFTGFVSFPTVPNMSGSGEWFLCKKLLTAPQSEKDVCFE